MRADPDAGPRSRSSRTMSGPRYRSRSSARRSANRSSASFMPRTLLLGHAVDQAPEPVAVEDRHAQLLGLRELRARAFARDDVVRLLRDRARRLAAGRP